MKTLDPLSKEEQEAMGRSAQRQAAALNRMNRVFKNFAPVKKPCSAPDCPKLSSAQGALTDRYCVGCLSFVHYPCSYTVRANVSLPTDLTTDMALACSENCFKAFIENWRSDEVVTSEIDDDDEQDKDSALVMKPLEERG